MWVGQLSQLVKRRPKRPAALVVGLALFVVGLLARLALEDWLFNVPFVTFYPAVAMGTLLCGWRIGLFVTVLSMVASWYLFVEPRDSFGLMGLSTLVALASFLAVCVFLVALVAALAEMVRRLDAAQAMHADLFRELQHRVANNMQLIASTLFVARRSIDDAAGREVLHQATARIAAMARLHRKLYDPDSYRDGLEPVLREVLEETFEGLPVAIEICLAPQRLAISQMTAIVLLANEAAINAAKHVFRPELGSAFEVTIRPCGSGRMKLVIRDDGPGLAAVPTAPEVSKRLGMTIMQSLARQLGGSLDVLDGPGFGLSVDFDPA